MDLMLGITGAVLMPLQALTGGCWSSRKQRSVSGKSARSANEQRRWGVLSVSACLPASCLKAAKNLAGHDFGFCCLSNLLCTKWL